MRNNNRLLLLPLLLAVCVLQTACIKDDCTHTYTYYEPVYRTKDEVRANIKSNAPQEVKNPGKIYIKGAYIFLNEIDKGIHVIDNSNPAQPKNLSFINIPGNMDMAVKGNTLYADLYQDLIAIDITNPQQIGTKKIIDDAFPHRRYANGFMADTNMIIINWNAKTQSISCSEYQNRGSCRGCIFETFSTADGNNKSAGASPFGSGGSMARFAIVNNYLYTVGNNNLDVFDINNSAAPTKNNSVPLNFGIETIYPFKDRLFIGSNTGMLIYSLQNPATPNEIGKFEHARVCDPVIAEDNVAFVTLRSGSTCAGFTNQLDVVNIQWLPATSLFKSYPMTNPHGLSKDGNTLFVCDGAAGLKVLNATYLSDIKTITTISNIDTYDVIAQNGVALVVAKDGLYQYDYTNLNNIRLLSKIGITQ